MDPRESISGVVAHLLVDRALEHRGDRVPGAVVHPIVELEVADGELGVVQVVVERVELRLVERAMLAELGVEPLQRVEEMALPRVVQRFAEIQVVQRLVARATAGRSSDQRRGGEAQDNNADQRFTSAHDLPFRQTPVANGYSLFTNRPAEWTRDRRG